MAKPTVPGTGQAITQGFLEAVVDGPYAWQDDVNAGGKKLSNLGGLNFGLGGSIGIQDYLSEITLTAAWTVIPSPVVAPPANSRLTVIITQDGTGGWGITWSADFVGASPEIDLDPGMTSIFQFVARSDGKWWLAAEPLLGLTGDAVTPGIWAAGLVYLLEQTLTEASTEITSPQSSPAAGSILSVYLAQDGTGEWAITWSADFIGPGTEIATGANEVSVFQFVARGGKWWLATLPALGVA